MEKIREYTEAGRTFSICEETAPGSASGYWAFENKYIDHNGKLTQQFNGISGFHSDSLTETISRVSQSVRIDALVESGIDRMTAVFMVISEH